MQNNEQLEKGAVTSIHPELLAGMNQEKIQNDIQNLATHLKDIRHLIIPPAINDRGTLIWLLNLGNNLSTLERCEGFAEHLKEYANNKLSAYFVSVVASSIMHKVDKLVLEPNIEGRRNKSDIRFWIDNEETFIECKCPELNPKFDRLKEHQHMFDVLKAYINHPHQVSITYEEVLSDNELDRLGEALKRLLPSVTSDGTIIHNEKLEVQVIFHRAFLNPSLEGHISGLQESLDTQEIHPMDHFFSNGKRISLAGPAVDYKSILLKQIKKSSRQAPISQSFILAVSINHMFGKLSDNVKAINAAFQPVTNTRFNGVALVKSAPSLTEIYPPPQFKYISNPYAKMPLSKRVESVFSSK